MNPSSAHSLFHTLHSIHASIHHDHQFIHLWLHSYIHASCMLVVCGYSRTLMYACIYAEMMINIHASIHSSIHACIHPFAHPSIPPSIGFRIINLYTWSCRKDLILCSVAFWALLQFVQEEHCFV